MDNRLLPHMPADASPLFKAVVDICTPYQLAARVEPDATERDLADVETTCDDGGAAYVIGETLDAMGALTLSERLEAFAGKLNAHCASLAALTDDVLPRLERVENRASLLAGGMAE